MRLGEMGEFYGVEDLEREFFEGIWGGEVWSVRSMILGWIVRNGGVVGFWGDVAIGKYSGLVSRCTKSFRENKPPILIGILI